MRTLTRYITLELVGWLAITLLSVTSVMVLVVVAGEAKRMNLGLGPTLRMLPFVMPTALAYAAPCATLFSMCLVYGRLSADNAIVATKALGIWPGALLLPGWMLGFVLSLVGVWLTDIAFSWGTVGVQRVVIQSLEEIAYGMLRTQRMFSSPRFSINVKEVQGRRLIRPIMHLQPNNDMPAVTILAAEAELTSDLKQNIMILSVLDCEIEMAPDITSVLPGRTELKYPLAYFSAKDLKEGSPAHLPMWQITTEIPAQRRRILELEHQLAAQSALALVSGELGDLSEATWRERRNQLADARGRLFRLQTEWPRRWANGFTILAFVVVGAPLAILFKKADVMTTFGLLFLPSLVIYYAPFIGCCNLAKTGAAPPYVVWAPNLAFFTAGLWLLGRVIRY